MLIKCIFKNDNFTLFISIQMTSQTSQTRYAPRNVLNANEIKLSIQARSQERQDEQHISAWLLNHFFRYLIGNYKPHMDVVIEITSLDEALQRLNLLTGENLNTTIPLWLSNVFDTDSKIYWIVHNHPEILDLEAKFLEFLNSRKGTSLERKLAKINAFQALSLYEYEHKLIEIQKQRGLIPHSPDAVIHMFQTPIGEFVEFNPTNHNFRRELAYESQSMRHCLGQFADKTAFCGSYGEYYAAQCEAKKIRLFSFRTENNQPKITICVSIDSSDTVTIKEVKGKQNQPPVEKYHDILIDFLNTLPCKATYPIDLNKIGIVWSGEKWQRISQVTDSYLKTKIVWQAPELAHAIKDRPRIADWLLAAKAPDILGTLEDSTYVKGLISDE